LTGLGIAFHEAHAIATNIVRLTLTGPAMHTSATAPGDAINPATWTIQRMDNLAYINAVYVKPVTPNIYDITCLQPFGTNAVQLTISTITLLDVNGVVCVPPRHANFAGIQNEDDVNPVARAAINRQVGRDIANPPTPRTDLGVVGGTMLVKGGDYQSVTGVDLVRKLILRRIITMPGEFFHLPDYGLGIGEKEPMTTSALLKLKSRAEKQIRKETEVVDAAVSITSMSNGTLILQVRAKTKGGQVADVTVPLAMSVAL
jgi:hypothetical protein